jgi:hypothetical protein
MAGKIEGDEYATFPPRPGDRHPSAGHPLPALRPHTRLPARQHQRGADRALPPSPPRSARHPHLITEPAPSAAGGPPQTPAGPKSTCADLTHRRASNHGASSLIWVASAQRAADIVGGLVSRLAVKAAPEWTICVPRATSVHPPLCPESATCFWSGRHRDGWPTRGRYRRRLAARELRLRRRA